MSIDVTQPAAPLGADAVTRSWRSLEPLRPVRADARKVNTKTVLGDPDDGLTWMRSRRTLASASVSVRARTKWQRQQCGRDYESAHDRPSLTRIRGSKKIERDGLLDGLRHKNRALEEWKRGHGATP
jgi:hypothetical protein